MTDKRIVFSFQKLLAPGRAEPMTTLSVKEPDRPPYNEYTNLFETNAIGAHVGQPILSCDNAAVGGQLFNALYTGESVRKLLDERSTLAGGKRNLPMYFDLSAADELNDFPWEMLWAAGDNFLALSKWPIGRMLQSYEGKVLSRKLEPPFRIAAVLSSLGVNPNSEWEALEAAVDASNADVEVLLLLSDTALHDSIQANKPAWLTVGLVSTEYVDLQTTITAFRPHLVHLFCHGSTKDGPHLEIATANDVLLNAAKSHHRLETQQIRELVRQSYESPWAIVLNACSSAQTNEESGARSLAASLVRDKGIQAVIGMRKPVLDKDAACFTRNFYQTLLDQMKSFMSKNGTRELDWASFTVDARQRLLDGRGGISAAASLQEWTLPVVVVRPDPFRFKTAKGTPTPGGDTAKFTDQFWGRMVAAMPANVAGNMPQQPPAAAVPPIDDQPQSQPQPTVQPVPPVQPAATSDDVPDFDSLQVVRCNAWTGTVAASAPLGSQRDRWAISAGLLPSGTALLAPPPAQPQDWQDPRIGWGVVLPDVGGLTEDQLKSGADAPEPIRALLAARPGSKVLRYRDDSTEFNTLRDYAAGADIPIATAPVGTEAGEIPDYLLIVGSPAAIPWTVQYKLNLVRKVGRLDLDPEGLSNYVNALLDGWKGCTTDFSSPLIWAVNHGGDITPLMRDAVAAPLAEAYRLDKDNDFAGIRFIDGTDKPATKDLLIQALAAQHPGVIVTSSHGKTGPLDQLDEMRRQLGFLVDGAYQVVEPSDVLSGWQPNGAIWFAQACCSAGAQNPSMYRGLFDETSDTGRVLDGVSRVGPISAPFPNALLGCAKPLRAFIGHVEPTFEWTLWHPATSAQLTTWVRTLMYNEICRGMPAGLALQNSRIYTDIGGLLLQHEDAVAQHAVAPDPSARRSALNTALYDKVTAFDRACTVLLGDPTVALQLP